MKISRWGYDDIITLDNLDNRGRIGKKAIDIFTNGQCHSFALAIHKLTGWDIYGLVDYSQDDCKSAPGHIVNRFRDTRDYIDIEGLGALKRRKEWYPKTKVIKLSEYSLHNLICYLPIEAEKAMPFAKNLLLKIGVI